MRRTGHQKGNERDCKEQDEKLGKKKVNAIRERLGRK
jgi:hypothetical protein